MRKNREMLNLVGGLIVGLILGLVIAAAGGDSLFGTASDPNNKGDDAIEIDPSKFYLVEFEDAESWLDSVDPETRNQLQAALDSVQGLIEADDFETYAASEDTQTSINEVLFALREALLREQGFDGSVDFSTCIGIDRNPYNLSGPGLYVYMELPESGSNNLPTSFEELSGPKESDILWSTACFEDDK